MIENEYIHELPKSPKEGDTKKKVVLRALKVHRDFAPLMELFVEDSDLVIDQYDNALYSGPALPGVFIHSKEVFNMHKKVNEKLDVPDWYPTFANRDAQNEIKNFMRMVDELKKGKTDVPPEFIEQKIAQIKADIDADLAKIKIGLEFLLKEGGYYNVMTNPSDGVFFWICLIGNCFVFIELNNKADIPIQFYAVPADKVFVNPEARRFRGSAQGRNVTQCLMVFEGSYDYYVEKVVKKLPKNLQEAAKNIKWGNLPGVEDIERLDTSAHVATNDRNRNGQWAMYFDLEMEFKGTLAGSEATIIEDYEGEEYPYEMNGEKFIPLAQFICHPKGRGIYGGGVGNYMSEPASTDEQNFNSGAVATMMAQQPIYALGLNGGMTAEQAEKNLREAEGQRADGLMGLFTYDASQGNMKIEQFSPEAKALGENRYVQENIERMKLQYGVNQSDISIDSSKRVGVADLEASNQVAIAQQIGQNNSGEYKFLLDFLVTQAKKIRKSNKTSVPAGEVTIRQNEMPISVGGMKLGELPELLKKYDVLITIDDESGVTSNNKEKKQALKEMLTATAGSPVQFKFAAELSKLNGMHYDESEFYPPQPEPVQ